MFDVVTGTGGEVIRGNRAGVGTLAFTPDDRRLVLGSNGFFRFADLAHADKEPRSFPESKVWFRALSVSPDGTKLLANGYGIVPGQRPGELADLLPGAGNNKDRDRQHALSVRSLTEAPVTLKVLQHAARVRRATFTADGQRVVTLTDDSQIHEWNWSAETRLASVAIVPKDPEQRALCRDMVLHPDGRHVIVSRTNGQIVIVRFKQK